ncbi:4-hydroxy-tetrahydrodipicolinate reductase [Weissella soli]|uniref:4-hydroxy-tetrahydrodipicolinate reductase n=1 Tax=Weissella soli TaxID=155866 RepID=UPI003C71A440
MQRVILAGGFGKMGLAIQAKLAETPDIEIVGIVSGHAHASAWPVFTNLADINVTADVWLDVTTPATVAENAKFALAQGMDVVIGTSGIAEAALAELTTLATTHERHVLVVPNFALSAVLLMQFAQQAAKYFPDAEILEIHHPGKLDAPSGTAKTTASLIAAARTATAQAPVTDLAARGDLIAGIPVHAMRLPGFVAEEEVVFSGIGESLRIKQTSFSRASFMNGVVLAVQQVATVPGLAVGLDKVL